MFLLRDLGSFLVQELIKKASIWGASYIFLEFFIIGEGEMWDGIEKILIQKVSQGVDVRIIYDDVGSLQCAPDFFDARLRKKGIECRKFNPWRPFMDVRLNNRDHRKMAVVDGKVVVRDGKLVHGDIDEIRADAKKQANRLWEAMLKYPETYTYHYDD